MKTQDSTRKISGQRRRQILDAALRCFLERGFDGTTMEQIRDESGASHGSIYHHFGSKEAIAIKLYAEGMEEYQQQMMAIMNEHRDPQQGIAAMIRRHLTWTAENRPRALYLTRFSMTATPGNTTAKIAELNLQFFRALHDWLKPFIESGEVVRVPPHLYAPLIFGPTSHYARHWLAERMPVDPAEATEVIASAVWRSLKNPR